MTQLVAARRVVLVARVGGDPGSGRASARQGGLAPARPDQRYSPPFPAAVPPGRGNIVRARQVIISGPNEGLFEYIGNPGLGNSPILWATAPGTAADPSGNPLEVSGGLAVARRAGNVIQQLIWLDPVTGSLFLGSGPRTSTYRMAAVDVANAQPYELDIVSPFDTGAAPVNVGIRMIAGPSSNAGQLLISSPAGASPLGLALAELGVGGSGFPQTLALGIGIPITDTAYRWVIDRNGQQQWGPGGASALDVTLSRPGAGQLRLAANPAAGTFLLTLAIGSTGVGGEHITMGQAADFALAVDVAGDTNPRFVVVGSGAHEWGPGNAAPDVTLARSAAAALTLTGALAITGVLTLQSGVAEQTSGGWTGAAEIGKGSSAQTTNNGTGFVNMLGGVVTTPSADLSTTGGWRVTESGHGTWGATLEALTMNLIVNGGSGPSVTVPTTAQTISANFVYRLTAEVMPETLGAAGTFTGVIRMEVSTAGAATVTFMAEITGVAINTTAGVGWLQQSHWAAAGPTITADQWTFERVSL